MKPGRVLRGSLVASLGALLSIACQGSFGDGHDAGSGADASGVMDASAPLDARVSDAAVDAGEPTDTGPAAPRDAGSDAGTDSGVLECRPEPRDCSPSAVSMEDYCIDGASCYLAEVQAAVREVIMVHPEWFDSSGACSVILDVDSFMDAVVAGIEARGVCAIRDPNAPFEEVTLKYSNAFTENFDIVASTGCARYGSAIYTSTCFPAWW